MSDTPIHDEVFEEVYGDLVLVEPRPIMLATMLVPMFACLVLAAIPLLLIGVIMDALR